MVDQRPYHDQTRFVIDAQQALGLWQRDAESWHFGILSLDPASQISNRWDLSVGFRYCSRHFERTSRFWVHGRGKKGSTFQSLADPDLFKPGHGIARQRAFDVRQDVSLFAVAQYRGKIRPTNRPDAADVGVRVAASVRSKLQAVSGPEVPFDERHSSILVSGRTCQDSEVATARTGVPRRGIDDLRREITSG